MTTTSKPCPRCKTRYLEHTVREGREVDLCPKCAGLWCEAENWDKEALGRAPIDQLADRTGLRVVSRETELNCPRCRIDMTAWKLPDIQDFEIDQCPSCKGVWFDHEEWDHLAALREWQVHQTEVSADMEWKHWLFQFFLGMPVEFNVRPRRFPIVTVMLILTCVVMFVIQLRTPGNLIEWANRPSDLGTPEGILHLFTYQFLHGSWLHLIGNLYLLYILGDNVEDVLGRVHFLIFYLLCGAMAGIPHDIISEAQGLDQPVVGASGAIAAVIGAYFVLFRKAKLTFMLVIFQFKVPAWLWLGGWFAIQLIGAYATLLRQNFGIDWFAHITGFILGVVWVLVQRKDLIESHPLLHLLDTERIR